MESAELVKKARVQLEKALSRRRKQLTAERAFLQSVLDNTTNTAQKNADAATVRELTAQLRQW